MTECYKWWQCNWRRNVSYQDYPTVIGDFYFFFSYSASNIPDTVTNSDCCRKMLITSLRKQDKKIIST